MAERAMQLQQVRIDALANNLANVDTAGFKQILTSVTEQVGASAAAQGGSTAGYGRGVWGPVAALDLQQATDQRPGATYATGRDTDFALVGEGYFVLQTEEGQELYSRNGSFVLDDKHRLITPDGLAVVGSGGPLTIEGGSFSVGRDGSVLVNGNSVGTLRVVSFGDPGRLEHRGSGRMAAPPDMPAQDVPKEQIQISQGYLEGSNVNPIDTLVNIIAAQRAFEIEAKILQSNDETLERSVNDLPRTT